MRALDDLVRRGLVRYDRLLQPGRLADHEGARHLRQRGFARFETVQAYYSIAGRDLEREIVPMVEDQGLGLMVWSPLAGGLLSGKFTRDEARRRRRAARSFDFPPVDKERAYDVVDAMRRSPRRTAPRSRASRSPGSCSASS